MHGLTIERCGNENPPPPEDAGLLGGMRYSEPITPRHTRALQGHSG
jgi:hypothetical protein